MKRIIYILFSVLLLTSCANEVSVSKDRKKEDKVEKVEIQRFDKKILEQPKSKKEVKVAESNILLQEDFDDLTFQKIKQLFEIYSLIQKKNTQTDFKDYAQKHFNKMWLHPQNAIRQLQQTGLYNYDSIQVVKIALLNQKPLDLPERDALYKVTVKGFKKGKSHTIAHKIKMYFMVEDYNLEGQIYKTIKTKVIGIY